MQFTTWLWLTFFLHVNITDGRLVEIDLFPTYSQPEKVPTAALSCSDKFNLTDPRNCCSIPYLLSPDVVEPCLEIPLSTIDLEGENCRAECVLNRTAMLVDGHFQLETAMKRLTNATSDDPTLTEYIQYAIGKCSATYFNPAVYNSTNSCTSTPRCLLDCIFAITYRKCPPQYWTASAECLQLVQTLNNCPHFLVHTDAF